MKQQEAGNVVLVVSLEQTISQHFIWISLWLLVLLLFVLGEGLDIDHIEDVANRDVIILHQLRIQHPHKIVYLPLRLFFPLLILFPAGHTTWTLRLD